jgi:hypothetical protein
MSTITRPNAGTVSARVEGLRRARDAAARRGDGERVRRLNGALRQEDGKRAGDLYRRGRANALRAGAGGPAGVVTWAQALMWADR